MAETVEIDVNLFVPGERNPNEMDEAKLDALARMIAKHGFLQPVLAVPFDDEASGTEHYLIVDGEHRWLAAKKNGLATIPAVVRDSFDPLEIEALRIGMNNLRGEINLKTAGDIAFDLVEGGWDPAEIAVSLGYSQSELDDLFELAREAVDDLGAGSPDSPEPEKAPGRKEVEGDDDKAPKNPFVISIEFESRGDFMRARRALRKAGGKGATLAESFFKLLSKVK